MKRASEQDKHNAKTDKGGPVEQERDRRAAQQSMAKSVNEVRDRRTVRRHSCDPLEARNRHKYAADEDQRKADEVWEQHDVGGVCARRRREEHAEC